jgi:L-lactate utilization protein LutC
MYLNLLQTIGAKTLKTLFLSTAGKALKTLALSTQDAGKEQAEKIAQKTKEKASDIAEETISTAVDQALNVIEMASQQIRAREIPTQNVQLEVSVNVASLVELKIKVDVPEEGDLQKIIVDVNQNATLTAPLERCP